MAQMMVVQAVLVESAVAAMAELAQPAVQRELQTQAAAVGQAAVLQTDQELVEMAEPVL
jgi:hypothetical protein